jgi:hypothetical protein
MSSSISAMERRSVQPFIRVAPSWHLDTGPFCAKRKFVEDDALLE